MKAKYRGRKRIKRYGLINLAGISRQGTFHSQFFADCACMDKGCQLIGKLAYLNGFKAVGSGKNRHFNAAILRQIVNDTAV